MVRPRAATSADCRLIVGPVFGPIYARAALPAREEPHYPAVSPVSPAQSRRLNRIPSRSAPVRVIRWLNCRAGATFLPDEDASQRLRRFCLSFTAGADRVPARVPSSRESGSRSPQWSRFRFADQGGLVLKQHARHPSGGPVLSARSGACRSRYRRRRERNGRLAKERPDRAPFRPSCGGSAAATAGSRPPARPRRPGPGAAASSAARNRSRRRRAPRRSRCAPDAPGRGWS